MHYSGDFIPGQTASLVWSTNSKTGGSISRSVLGTITVRRVSSNTTSSVGVIDTADIAGIVGVHMCNINLSNAFYAPHDEYLVVINGMVIDGETVNAVIGQFSIMNRSHSRLWVAGTVDSSSFPPTVTEFESSNVTTEADNNNLSGRTLYASIGGALFKQAAVIESSSLSGGKSHFAIPVGAAMTAPFINGAPFLII